MEFNFQGKAENRKLWFYKDIVVHLKWVRGFRPTLFRPSKQFIIRKLEFAKPVSHESKI